ncbi:thrombospondin-like protein [Achlya hypogyna]|uniref:Thrombospondin-like protein n=1 Tax=Achlya hypogyna TaxID=1202772 RepID=A0A1V9Y9N9_ACHHY|nr:thrombospondin-like protein [Achlya hypogyna]
MRLALSIATIVLAQTYAGVQAYTPSDLDGVVDPVLIATIEGYMPPICAQLYDNVEHWSEWSDCSATCGPGQQVRYLNSFGVKELSAKQCMIRQDSKPCNGTVCPQDCLYSEWSEWSPCDAKTGSHERSRTVTTPALNGGKECLELWGSPTDVETCAVPCEGDWGEFTTCSATTATKSRSFIATQLPLNGGKACPPTEVVDCDPACGSVPWGDYSTCDPSTGTYTRTRAVPLDANYVRVTLSLRNNQCATVDTQPCNIDCKLGDWEEFGACDATTGYRTATRPILQEAVNCGQPCNSIDVGTITTKSEPCAVDCVLSDWSDWSECDPQLGLRTQTRTVITNPLNGGQPAATLSIRKSAARRECSPESCKRPLTTELRYPKRDASKNCVLATDEPCTLDAVMTDWSEYTPCDETGLQTRTRKIVHGACNGGEVAGETQETKACSPPCSEQNNPWNEWSECDPSTGRQTRTRTIVNPPAANQPVCATTDTRDCAVNCVMDSWGPLSECDECTGIQTQTRSIIISDRNGGNKCGDTMQSINCAVVCQATPWGDWSAPDDTCTCTRTRTKLSEPLNNGTCILSESDPGCAQNCEVSDWVASGTCIKSGPNAGKQLYTRSVLKKQCNDGAACPLEGNEKYEPCNVDCRQSDWTEFSACNLESQTQTRTRSVLQPAYNNGAACENDSETRACGTCADIMSDYVYSDCNPATGTRTGTASYLYKPRDGLTCTTTVSVDCDVNCVLSPWNEGECNVQGDNAGLLFWTRTIVTAPLHNGVACDSLIKSEPCVVDCKPGDTWGPWSDCNAQGFTRRTVDIKYPAQNGGRNDECLVEEQKTCAVDCVIDPDSGEVTQKSLNGGRTCAAVAEELGIPGNFDNYSGTSSVSFLAMVASNKTYALAAVATGGMGVMFLVGFFTTRQRHGYSTISRQAL